MRPTRAYQKKKKRKKKLGWCVASSFTHRLLSSRLRCSRGIACGPCVRPAAMRLSSTMVAAVAYRSVHVYAQGRDRRRCVKRRVVYVNSNAVKCCSVCGPRVANGWPGYSTAKRGHSVVSRCRGVNTPATRYQSRRLRRQTIVGRRRRLL